jgi:thiamine pyrophosphate-dependent acetolactate synthase large subunit-like protein
MWIFEDINLAKVAEAMGCFSVRVERPSDIQSVLERAFAANKPAVIDVVSDIKALAARGWTTVS